MVRTLTLNKSIGKIPKSLILDFFRGRTLGFDRVYWNKNVCQRNNNDRQSNCKLHLNGTHSNGENEKSDGNEEESKR